MPFILSDFKHIRPHHEIDQEKSQDWIAEVHARAENQEGFHEEMRSKIARLGLGKDRIANRGVHIPDFSQEDWSKMEIYPVLEKPQGKGFAERSAFFDREVTQIFQRFYPEHAALPKHLIHVTCTGYVAPSPAQKLISLRCAGPHTSVTHAYHMGCYGSISAIRIGLGFTAFASPSPITVDIVHTEICSLHIHPLRHALEQLLVQNLFADGFIKYTIQAEASNKPHLKVLAIHDEVIPNSAHCMTWRCEDHGMGMTLSKEVPVLIARHLEGFLQRLCALAGLNSAEVIHEALFAVHPGGPKILQQIQELLQLDTSQIDHSTLVLKHYGNMSSATLPHIWERMLEDPQVPRGQKIISLAFGPGLGIAGGLFELEK